MRALPAAASAAFYGYTAGLVALGVVGMVLPEIDLRLLYRTSLDPLPRAETVAILHPYRFLKGFPLAIGICGIGLRREILGTGRAGTAFLAVLFSALAGRILSVLLDGPPRPALLAFSAAELGFGTVIALHRRALARASPTGAPEGSRTP